MTATATSAAPATRTTPAAACIIAAKAAIEAIVASAAVSASATSDARVAITACTAPPYHGAMPRHSPFHDEQLAFATRENERRARLVAEAGRGDAQAAAFAANRAEVSWLPFGPDDADPEQVRQVVAAYGPFEPEYAAIRRSVALVDPFHRATLRVTGAERRDFLNRMLTQDVATLKVGQSRRGFWLNRKGRIDTDLLIVETGDEILLDVDACAASEVRESLDRFLFSEDVQIEEASTTWARLSLHGPKSGALLDASGVTGADALAPGGVAAGVVSGSRVIAAREDTCATKGFELFVPIDGAIALWQRLVEQARPAGWEAWNSARIEGGTPLFRVDFGQESLPHETGVVRSHVSFRKGCYPGQEIVARMESLGAPKQQVVAFRAAGEETPVSGAQLRRPSEPMGTPIGVVTSSTISPLLRSIIGLATVRSALAEPGSKVAAHADGHALEVEVLGPPAPLIDATSGVGAA
ncbi:MAG: aminomethyltransferase family protein [Phycisphaeraceae bacterium]|nr:aminomethyltransferase family protein [Phycisphaeraceae bacterium]